MQLSPRLHFLVPDGQPVPDALARTTHLGIGAHSDDLEFMALHGILDCYDDPVPGFGGITCTNGAGSVRAGDAAHLSEEAFVALRREEQEEAARIGRYSFMAQVDLPSRDVPVALADELVPLLHHLRPRVVYTHNPADKHPTHRAVLSAVVKAIRELPVDERPGQVLGCEVWRGLDWMDDADKVVMDVSRHPDLQTRLHAVFQSQLEGGKRYDLAVAGRALANATFSDAYQADEQARSLFAMDLTPLIREDGPSIAELTDHYLDRFVRAVRESW